MSGWSAFISRDSGPVEWCDAGQHVVAPGTKLVEYNDKKWCPDHPVPQGPLDPLPIGWCTIGKRHHAKDGVRTIPAGSAFNPTDRDKYACRQHWNERLRDFHRRGDYGKKL